MNTNPSFPPPRPARFDIKLKRGLDSILFGCTIAEVQKVLGGPDVVSKYGRHRIEACVNLDYDELGLSFRFDADIEFSLACISSEKDNTFLFNTPMIGREKEHVLSMLKQHGLRDPVLEDMSCRENPDWELVTYGECSLNLWFKDRRCTTIQWSFEIDEKDDAVWPV